MPVPFGLRLAKMSNTVAVVVRDSGDIVLVDVGWNAATCADAVGTLGRLRAASLGVDVCENDALHHQLQAHGLDPARVTTIIATHLHLDHVGGASDFPNAEVVCTDRELVAFRAFPRALGYRAEDLAKQSRIRTVVLDGAPTHGFPASKDLFEDGDVVLLDARGHTAGHVAVALRSRDACYVHVGDAAYQSWELGLSPAGPSLIARMTAWKQHELRRTYENIRACEADLRRPVIVPSHDVGVFEGLPRTAGRTRVDVAVPVGRP